MVDCPCGYGKNIPEEQETCHICRADVTPLHRFKALPKIYCNEGVRLAEEGQLDMAVERLMTAISLNSGYPDAYIVIGKIYLHKGLYDEAIKYLERTLKISPDNEDAKSYIAKAKELKEANSKKNRFKKKLTIAGFGIAFISGILLVFLHQKINQMQLVQPSQVTYVQPKLVTYIVQKGDSLSKISQEKYGNYLFWRNIYKANKDKIKDPNILYVGEEIVLGEFLVKPK